VGVISLLTALALMAPGPSPAAAPLGPETFGVNAQGLFPYQPEESWPTHVNAMAASGLRVVRFDAAWNTIEPRPPVGGAHRFDWRFYDHVVSALASAGLRWYPILDYSAAWAGSVPGNLKSAPADPEAFATFARALAWRYGRGGSFWREHPEYPTVPVTSYEIWNEENSNYFWRPQPDAAAYATLYMSARTAIRAQDPDAEVVVGGLVPNRGGPQFLADMLAARPDAAGQIDAVAIHPYAQTPQGVAALVLTMRSALDANGLGGVPLEITEVGWTTRGPGAVGDEVRAADFTWITDWIATCDCGVTRFLPHTWVTTERRADSREDWFGLYHPDGQPTPAGLAYALAVQRAGQPAHVVPQPGQSRSETDHTTSKPHKRRHRRAVMRAGRRLR
jgi:hypothetical protein